MKTALEAESCHELSTWAYNRKVPASKSAFGAHSQLFFTGGKPGACGAGFHSTASTGAKRSGESYAGSSHRSGAEAQSFVAGLALDHPAKSGDGNHGKSAAESDNKR